MLRQGNHIARAAIARFIVVALFFDAMLPLLPYLSKANDMSARQFQVVLGVCYVLFALAQLASAWVIAACGAYRAIAWSSIMMSGAGLALGMVSDALLFAVIFAALFACNGIGSNATRLALRAASSDAGFKRLLAWASAAIEIKQIVMPALIGAIAVSLGWRWALLLLVLPVLVCGLWMLLLARSAPSVPLVLGEFDAGVSAWRRIAGTPMFLMPTLIVAAFELAFSPISARLPFVLTEELGLSPLQAGMVLSCASAAAALGLLVSGYLAKHSGSRTLIKLGVLIIAIGVLCMAAAGRYGSTCAVAGMIIVQLAFGFIVIPCAADVLNMPATDRIRASSLFGFVQPVLSGLVVAGSGSVPGSGQQMAMILSVCALGLLSLLLMLRSTRSVHAALLLANGHAASGRCRDQRR